MSQRMRRSRMFGWDGNPVRRRIDRLEGYMVAGLIGVFLISAPVLGVAGYEGRLFFARCRLARWGEQCRAQCGEP